MCQALFQVHNILSHLIPCGNFMEESPHNWLILHNSNIINNNDNNRSQKCSVLCARHCAKFSVYIISFDTYKIFLSRYYEYSHFVDEELERFMNFYRYLTLESMFLITKVHCDYIILNKKCSINVCWWVGELINLQYLCIRSHWNVENSDVVLHLI